MLVMIKSGPDTMDGIRGIKMARSMAADIVLLQNGVYFTEGQKLEDLGFHNKVYSLDEDRRLRGLTKADPDRNIKEIGYDALIDIMSAEDKIAGMF